MSPPSSDLQSTIWFYKSATARYILPSIVPFFLSYYLSPFFTLVFHPPSFCPSPTPFYLLFFFLTFHCYLFSSLYPSFLFFSPLPPILSSLPSPISSALELSDDEDNSAPHSADYLSRRKRKKLNTIVPNPRKPRTADYMCANCSEVSDPIRSRVIVGIAIVSYFMLVYRNFYLFVCHGLARGSSLWSPSLCVCVSLSPVLSSPLRWLLLNLFSRLALLCSSLFSYLISPRYPSPISSYL